VSMSTTTTPGGLRTMIPGAGTRETPTEREVRAERELAAIESAHAEGLERLLGQGVRSLGDDELLLLVSQFTQHADVEIQQKVLGLSERAARTRALGEALGEVQRQVQAAGERRNDTRLRLDAEVTVPTGAGGSERITLGALLERLGVRLPDRDARLTTEFVDAFRTQVSAAGDFIRSEGEASQLQLQQLMSRRSQMLQITSNMMASRNETRKSIAQNIRG
jgi:hypothetical protein